MTIHESKIILVSAQLKRAQRYNPKGNTICTTVANAAAKFQRDSFIGSGVRQIVQR